MAITPMVGFDPGPRLRRSLRALYAVEIIPIRRDDYVNSKDPDRN